MQPNIIHPHALCGDLEIVHPSKLSTIFTVLFPEKVRIVSPPISLLQTLNRNELPPAARHTRKNTSEFDQTSSTHMSLCGDLKIVHPSRRPRSSLSCTLKRSQSCLIRFPCGKPNRNERPPIAKHKRNTSRIRPSSTPFLFVVISTSCILPAAHDIHCLAP